MNEGLRRIALVCTWTGYIVTALVAIGCLVALGNHKGGDAYFILIVAGALVAVPAYILGFVIKGFARR